MPSTGPEGDVPSKSKPSRRNITSGLIDDALDMLAGVTDQAPEATKAQLNKSHTEVLARVEREQVKRARALLKACPLPAEHYQLIADTVPHMETADDCADLLPTKPFPAVCTQTAVTNGPEYGMLLQIWHFMRTVTVEGGWSETSADLGDGCMLEEDDVNKVADAQSPLALRRYPDEVEYSAERLALAEPAGHLTLQALQEAVHKHNEEVAPSPQGSPQGSPPPPGEPREAGETGSPSGDASPAPEPPSASTRTATAEAFPTDQVNRALAHINPQAIGFASPEHAARLSPKLQECSLEDLAAALQSTNWRGQRLISRLHLLLLRQVLDFENTAVMGDDEDEDAAQEVPSAWVSGVVTHTMLTPLTWPEVLRCWLMYTQAGRALITGPHNTAVAAAAKALEDHEYLELPHGQRLALLTALFHAASYSSAMHRVLVVYARQEDRHLNAKREQDQALQFELAALRERRDDALADLRAKEQELKAELDELTKRLKAQKKGSVPTHPAKSDLSKTAWYASLKGALPAEDAKAALEARADLEARLAEALAEKDLRELQSWLTHARKHGGKGLQWKDSTGKRIRDPVLLTCMLEALKLEAEQVRTSAAEEEQAAQAALDAEFAPMLLASSPSGTLLGTDRAGRKYWLFPSALNRVYVESRQWQRDKAEAAAEAAAAQVLAQDADEFDPPSASAMSGASEREQAGAAHWQAAAARRAYLVALHDPAHYQSVWGFIDTVEGIAQLREALDKRHEGEKELADSFQLLDEMLSERLYDMGEKLSAVSEATAAAGLQAMPLERLAASGLAVTQLPAELRGKPAGADTADGLALALKTHVQAATSRLKRRAGAWLDPQNVMDGPSRRPRRAAAAQARDRLGDAAPQYAEDASSDASLFEDEGSVDSPGARGRRGRRARAEHPTRTVVQSDSEEETPGAGEEENMEGSSSGSEEAAAAGPVRDPRGYVACFPMTYDELPAQEALSRAARACALRMLHSLNERSYSRSPQWVIDLSAGSLPGQEAVRQLRSLLAPCGPGHALPTIAIQLAKRLPITDMCTALVYAREPRVVAALLLAIEEHLYAPQRDERHALHKSSAEQAGGDDAGSDAGYESHEDGWSAAESDDDEPSRGAGGAAGSSEANAGDDDEEDDEEGAHREHEHKGFYKLWLLRSQRRNWRRRTRRICTGHAAALALQQLHAACAKGRFAAAPYNLRHPRAMSGADPSLK